MIFKTCIVFPCRVMKWSYRSHALIKSFLINEIRINAYSKKVSVIIQSYNYDKNKNMSFVSSIKLSQELESNQNTDIDNFCTNEVSSENKDKNLPSTVDLMSSSLPCYSLEDTSSPSQSPPSKKLLLMSTHEQLCLNKQLQEEIISLEKAHLQNSESEISNHLKCEMASGLDSTDFSVIEANSNDNTQVVYQTKDNKNDNLGHEGTFTSDIAPLYEADNMEVKIDEQNSLNFSEQQDNVISTMPCDAAIMLSSDTQMISSVVESSSKTEATNLEISFVNNNSNEAIAETIIGKEEQHFGNSFTDISSKDTDTQSSEISGALSVEDNLNGNDNEELINTSVSNSCSETTVESSVIDIGDTFNSDAEESELSLFPFANEALSEMESEDEFPDVYSLKNLFKGKLSYANDDRKKKKEKKSGDGSKRLRPNYFVGVQVANPEIHSGIKLIQDDIVTKEPLLKKALIDVKTSHLTLMVLHLANNEDIERASSILENCYRKIEKLISTPLTLHFEGLGHFQNQVLFAKVKSGEGLTRLESIANTVEESFQSNGMAIESKSFKPHLTILKLSKAPMLYKKGIKKIKQSLYVDHMEKSFGSQLINSLQLLAMTKPKDEKGYYFCSKEIDFNLKDLPKIETEPKEKDSVGDKPWKLEQQQQLLKKNLRLAKRNIRYTIHSLTKAQLEKAAQPTETQCTEMQTEEIKQCQDLSDGQDCASELLTQQKSNEVFSVLSEDKSKSEMEQLSSGSPEKQ